MIDRPTPPFRYCCGSPDGRPRDPRSYDNSGYRGTREHMGGALYDGGTGDYNGGEWNDMITGLTLGPGLGLTGHHKTQPGKYD